MRVSPLIPNSSRRTLSRASFSIPIIRHKPSKVRLLSLNTSSSFMSRPNSSYASETVNMSVLFWSAANLCRQFRKCNVKNI